MQTLGHVEYPMPLKSLPDKRGGQDDLTCSLPTARNSPSVLIYADFSSQLIQLHSFLVLFHHKVKIVLNLSLYDPMRCVPPQ